MRIGKATGTLQLTSNAEGIARAASRDYMRALNQRIRTKIPQLRENLKGMVKDWLLNSEDFDLLRNDEDIRGQLGVPNMPEALEAIASAVAQTVVVRFLSFKRFGGNRITGGVTIHASPKDSYEYLYKLSEAWVGGENGPMFGWLKALLEQGDEIVIRDYRYSSKILSPDKIAQYSRTGIGIMMSKAGSGWRVPPPVAGSPDNNVLSRALSSPEVQGHIKREFQKLLT